LYQNKLLVTLTSFGITISGYVFQVTSLFCGIISVYAMKR